MAVTLVCNDHFMNRLLYFSFRVACLLAHLVDRYVQLFTHIYQLKLILPTAF